MKQKQDKIVYRFFAMELPRLVAGNLPCHMHWSYTPSVGRHTSGTTTEDGRLKWSGRKFWPSKVDSRPEKKKRSRTNLFATSACSASSVEATLPCPRNPSRPRSRTITSTTEGWWRTLQKFFIRCHRGLEKLHREKRRRISHLGWKSFFELSSTLDRSETDRPLYTTRVTIWPFLDRTGQIKAQFDPWTRRYSFFKGNRFSATPFWEC